MPQAEKTPWAAMATVGGCQSLQTFLEVMLVRANVLRRRVEPVIPDDKDYLWFNMRDYFRQAFREAIGPDDTFKRSVYFTRELELMRIREEKKSFLSMNLGEHAIVIGPSSSARGLYILLNGFGRIRWMMSWEQISLTPQSVVAPLEEEVKNGTAFMLTAVGCFVQSVEAIHARSSAWLRVNRQWSDADLPHSAERDKLYLQLFG